MAYNRSEMRAARVRRDLRQADVAHILGVVPQVYWRKENGVASFSLDDVSKLRDKMQLTNDEVNNIFFA